MTMFYSLSKFYSFLKNKYSKKFNFEEKYSSYHTICAVDWNGGTLFFQWILTLVCFINKNYKSPFIIILIGPDSDFKNFINIKYSKNIKVLKYSNLNIDEILSFNSYNSLINKQMNLYIHGWDKFSGIFVKKNSFAIAKFFNKLNVYSDGSKPIINLSNIDFLDLSADTKFDQLTTLAFTPIDTQNDLNYLLKKNNLLKEEKLYKIFNSIKHNLISSEFHIKACNQFFPIIKTDDNKEKIQKGSTLIVLRYWGMSSYKFDNYKNTIEIILEQIKEIEPPSKNKRIYIKRDFRLSSKIQDEVIKRLSSLYNVFNYDEIISKYKVYFHYYEISFGLEVLFYNFPSLFLNFNKIYSFDGSFCWFISQLSNSLLKRFDCDVFIGANSALDYFKKSRPSTIKHIEKQSRAQILPFLKDKRFIVDAVIHLGEKQNLFRIKKNSLNL